MNDYNFSMEIRWSAADGLFLAIVPELPGCIADGQTVAEACAAAEEMAREWVETARELGRPIPNPVTHELHYTRIRKLAENIAKKSQAALQEAVNEVLQRANERILEAEQKARLAEESRDWLKGFNANTGSSSFFEGCEWLGQQTEPNVLRR